MHFQDCVFSWFVVIRGERTPLLFKYKNVAQNNYLYIIVSFLAVERLRNNTPRSSDHPLIARAGTTSRASGLFFDSRSTEVGIAVVNATH
jgi:hypothetical protein